MGNNYFPLGLIDFLLEDAIIFDAEDNRLLWNSLLQDNRLLWNSLLQDVRAYWNS